MNLMKCKIHRYWSLHTHTAESVNIKLQTYFTGKITLHLTHVVNTEYLQHCVPYRHGCFRYLFVNILHKGDNMYNNKSNNNNNNNNNIRLHINSLFPSVMLQIFESKQLISPIIFFVTFEF